MINTALTKLARESFAQSTSQTVHFLENKEDNEFLNDLSNFPHAFVLACLMDRHIGAEEAWVIPVKIRDTLGTFSLNELRMVSPNEYRNIFQKEKLHRFNDKLAEIFHAAVHRIHDVYDGDASKIWSGKPSSSTVVYRFLEFKGAAVKIAKMAANILARQFRIPLSDYYSVDIVPDITTRRAMTRMGLVPVGASDDLIIYKVRELSSDFPGIIDFPCWEIGQHWCKPKNPICTHCIVKDDCPKIVS